MRIDYYFSPLSTYAYLAGTRLEEIAARYGTEITYKPMDIIGLFARTGGTAPADRHPSRMDYRAQELRRWSKKTGLPLNPKPMFWPTNPAPASYAIIAAQDAGGGDMGKLVHGVLRACFAEEKDVAEDAVVAECLENAGFDPGLTLSGMLTGAETYARNTEEAVDVGVFGSPFYVCEDGEKFWGQDRLDDLEAHLAGTA
ncbi:2-hydroxychromene-2-carboxylate isomerase [Alisedimentitalea sp. MJ-SS2]|uniref:2-hydroxychromene-2-carboxylate isomerase n=1 Tax=Aliisedimentitalea sp. MJ-SS2 TaxID=3049795 RepID=UPI00291096BD|nr:2-hydroxychromene-2-carboxylate isomerase [Alisedimentitalea sp. MJ-SS2]MDU8927279.1 2-hydroxychromene-2-carboxylate isomerase [Alisedimentitalea sp. MJ-SS2]